MSALFNNTLLLQAYYRNGLKNFSKTLPQILLQSLPNWVYQWHKEYEL